MRNVIGITFFYSILLLQELHGSSGLVVHGTLQADVSAWFLEAETVDSAVSFSGINMLSLEVKSDKLKQAKVEGMVDIYQLYGRNAEYFTNVPLQDTASFPVNTLIAVDLRTLYGALYLPWADVTIGRQIVNYGKGMLFSPLDVFSTVNLLELSFKRSGSDIAMAAIPIGELSGVDIVSEFPIGNRDYASSVRGFTTVMGWDLSAAGIYRHHSGEITGGIACKGDLEVGVVGELVTHYNRYSHEAGFDVMGGIDYSLHSTLFLTAEYWFRDRGVRHLIYDKHNLFGSLQYIINDLMSVSTTVITTLPDEQVLATLQYQYNILQSVDTQWFLRYYRLNDLDIKIPEGEAGVRVIISF